MFILILLVCPFKGISGNFTINSANDSTKTIQTLIDSNEVYAFGYSCTNIGRLPKGRVAINTLASIGNFKLLDSIFHISQNKVGKMYIAEALLKLNLIGPNKFSDESKAKITAFLNSDQSISTCSGCLFYASNIKELSTYNKELRKLIRKN